MPPNSSVARKLLNGVRKENKLFSAHIHKTLAPETFQRFIIFGLSIVGLLLMVIKHLSPEQWIFTFGRGAIVYDRGKVSGVKQGLRFATT